MASNFTFDLPEDILRLVIDAYAAYSNKNDVLRLLSVSRVVKASVEPYIFSKVILKSNRQVLAFAAALHGELVFCRPGRYVKSLWFLCTDLFLTQQLSAIPELCPNLKHLAFHGKWAPFSHASRTPATSIGISGGEENPPSPPRLTRLTICSPSLLQVSFFNAHPPVQWEHLTHLHILGPGDINDSTLYDHLLSEHLDRLVSLTHLCIELTYPSPETEIVNYTFFSEAALFYVYVNEGLFRDMVVNKRLPSLRNIHIKSNFTYPRFRVLWDDLRKRLEDVKDVVTFEMRALPNQDFYENTLPGCELMETGVWKTLMQNALEETERRWMKEDS